MNIKIIINVEIAPVLPNSNVVTSALGISATIPENIINVLYYFNITIIINISFYCYFQLNYQKV